MREKFSGILEGGKGVGDGGSASGGDVAAADLVEAGEHGVGLSEGGDALGIGVELGAGEGIEGDVGGEGVNVGASAAAAERECGAAGIDGLRNDGAGGASEGGRGAAFDLLGRFREDELLVGADEQEDDFGFDGELIEGAVEDVAGLSGEDRDRGKVLFADVAEVVEDLQSVAEVLLAGLGETEVVGVLADGAGVVVGAGGGENAGGGFLPELAAGGNTTTEAGYAVGQGIGERNADGGAGEGKGVDQ